MPKQNKLIGFLVIFILILVWSAIKPHDYLTWALEVFPAVIGVAILAFTYKKFQFTTFIYFLILLHTIILIVGGHYTYALNPLFEYIKEIFNLSRNHYDRLGHFAQGFLPALLAREILIRKSPLKEGGWLAFTIISFCLAVSAVYELIEWAGAMIFGSGADAFLGTQGDIFDTQKDMLMALIGATLALLFFSRMHDKKLKAEGMV
jgi:putative membrane protein